MRVYFLFVLLVLSWVGSASAQSDSSSVERQVQNHARKAHELLSQKKPELAAKEFAAIVALDPHNLDAQGNLGVLLFFQGDYAGAEPHLRATVEQQPDLAKIRALLGMCERHLGKTDLARADLEAAFPLLKEPSVQLEAGLELIEIYSAAHELEKAAGVVDVLKQSAPTDPRVLYTAYRIYTDLASEAVLGLSVAAPESGQMHQAMAHELARQGDLPGAIASFRKAIEANPRLPGIHFELAEALHASAEPKLQAEAEQEYKLAVAANNLDVKALDRLGDITATKSDLSGAASYYQRALVLMPGDPDAAIGMAYIDTEKNDEPAAVSLLEQVVASDPTNILAHYRLSSVYRRLHRFEDSKQQLEEYQKYKAVKDKMSTIYKDMRVDTPQAESGK
jgi:tetratricopeptide (TPR) repeat protein